MSTLLAPLPVPMDVMLDLREAELNRRESALRRELFDQSAQHMARERDLLAERDRLLATIQELHHRLRRFELIGAIAR